MSYNFLYAHVTTMHIIWLIVAVCQGTDVWSRILKVFAGSDPDKRTALLDPDTGAIHRPALATIVFNDPDKLRQLSSMMRVPVLKKLLKRIASCFLLQGHSVVFIEAPLLFESGIVNRMERCLAAISLTADGQGSSESATMLLLWIATRRTRFGTCASAGNVPKRRQSRRSRRRCPRPRRFDGPTWSFATSRPSTRCVVKHEV